MFLFLRSKFGHTKAAPKIKTCVDTHRRFGYIKPALQYNARGPDLNLRKGCIDARLLLIMRWH